MSGLHMAIEVDFAGVFWDKSATDKIMSDYQEDVLDEVALQTGVKVVDAMQAAFVAPRPYYWTTVGVEYVSATRRKVTDYGSVVYNFWLEGIGSRNFPATRFRGYGHWRATRNAMAPRARGIARDIWPACRARLNA